MKFLFYAIGVVLYVIIATAIRMNGFILGGLPSALLFFCTIYLIPRILLKIFGKD